MKDNRFEQLYGFVFRSLAKSILKEFVAEEDEQYLTIGILQFHPYDESFSYSPTLNNCLLLPEEINELKFPTEKEYLWNYELIKYLGIYLGQTKSNRWIHELLNETRTISKENDSTYSITYDGYDEFISSWEGWYDNNLEKLKIDFLSQNEEVESKKLLNQIFYFGSYLLTITFQIAYGGPPNERTYAEGMYLAISNPQLLTSSDFFDKTNGLMVRGKKIRWTNQPQTRILKAELNQVLEICFRQPFGVSEKISLLKNIVDKSFKHLTKLQTEYFLNATAVPLTYHGEFLGICYLSQPYIKNQINNIADQADRLKKKVDASKINGILYHSRYATARLALQKINEESFKQESIFRVFNLCHLYSSSPVVALIDHNNDSIFIRRRHISGYRSKMQTTKLSTTGSHFITFLETFLPEIKEYNLTKQSFHWYDIFNEHISLEKGNEKTAYNSINLFNEKFFEFLEVEDSHDEYKITSFIYLKIEVGGILYSILFFNSNFVQLYKTDASIDTKQSYALIMHTSVKQLIETEQFHRSIYYQNKQFQEDIKQGIIHYIKGFLKQKILKFLEISVREEDRVQLIRNCNSLASSLRDWLEVFNFESKTYPIKIEELKNIWVDVISEYSDSNTNFLFIPDDELLKGNARIISNIKGLRIIFSEIVNNALDEYEINEIFDGTVTLSISIDFKIIINNSYTWIQTKYLGAAGLRPIVSEKHLTTGEKVSTGIGFIRCEGILSKIGAIKYDKRHFELRNIDAPKGFDFEFKLEGEIS